MKSQQENTNNHKQGPNPISDEINNTKDDILARLNKLIANCFPGKKWFGMVGKDNQLTFILNGLPEQSASFLSRYFENEKLNCECINKGATHLVKVSDNQLEDENFFNEERQIHFDTVMKAFLSVHRFLEQFADVDVIWHEKSNINITIEEKRSTFFECTPYSCLKGQEMYETFKECLLYVARECGFSDNGELPWKLIDMTRYGYVRVVLIIPDCTDEPFIQYLANADNQLRLQLMAKRWAQSEAKSEAYVKVSQNEKVIADEGENDSLIVLNTDESKKIERLNELTSSVGKVEKPEVKKKTKKKSQPKENKKVQKEISIQKAAGKVLALIAECEAKEKDKLIKEVKAILLKIIRAVIHVDKWEPCDEGFYALPKAKKNYDIRLHNTQVMLAYAWKGYGFSNHDERVQVEHVDGSDRFVVTQAVLEHENLAKGICDKEFVDKVQKIAAKVGMLADKLKSVEGLDEMLKQLEKESSDKVKKQDDEWKKQRKYSLQQPKLPKVKDKKKKKKPKQKQVRVTVGQAAKPKKKPENKHKNNIPAQDSRRYLDPNRVDAGNKRFFSTTGAVHHEFTVQKKEVVEKPENDLLKKLDTTFDDGTVLEKLDQLINKLGYLIKIRASNKYDVSVYVAGWHYLHAQLCNLLAHLPGDHAAKKYIFTPIGYSGKKLYDAQKHVYFPTGVPGDQANYCFKDVSAIKAQISYILDGHMPSEESAQKANAVVKAWVSYLNYEFKSDKCCLDEIIAAHNTLEEFGAWLTDRIKEYTTCLKDLFKKYDEEQSVDEKQAIEYAIRFYVSRIGELAGHLPYNKRDKFLKYCRQFRNAVSHTYENSSDDENNNNNAEPEFNLTNLKKFLPANNNVAFFSGKNQKMDSERFECFVNNKYHYSPETIALLAEIKIDTLNKKIPVVVSKPVTFKVQTNVYAMLKESRDKLNSGSGLLLIPAKIESEAGVSVPVAISLHFSKKGDLTEVAFSQVTSHMPHVKKCMEAFGKKWCEQSGQKGSLKSPKEVFPQIKADEVDNYGVMHVELLFRLAERKVKNGKTSAMPNEMKKVRDEHIRTMWKAGHQEHYVDQMLKRHVKPVVSADKCRKTINLG